MSENECLCIKIAIIGSDDFDDYNYLSKYLFVLNSWMKKQDKSLLVCLKYANTGFSRMLYSICQYKLNIPMIVFPTYHEKWHPLCEGSGVPKYMFGKKYDVRNYFRRDNNIIKVVDGIIHFGKIEKSNENLINMAIRKHKPIIFERKEE